MTARDIIQKLTDSGVTSLLLTLLEATRVGLVLNSGFQLKLNILKKEIIEWELTHLGNKAMMHDLGDCYKRSGKINLLEADDFYNNLLKQMCSEDKK
jgi:hypothetical protein